MKTSESPDVPKTSETSVVSELLNQIATVFAKPNEVEAFINTWTLRAASLLNKTVALGYSEGILVYVPAASEYTFESLLGKLHETRKEKGCEWDNEWRWASFWSDKNEVFGDYGLKDEPQLFVLLRGEGKDGLFFTNTYIFEQIAKAKEFFTEKEGTTYLSPAAYISAQIILAPESEDGTAGLLDYNDGDYTFTMFPQFSDDGFIETTGGRCVPNMLVYDVGRLRMGGSYGCVFSHEGLRFVVKE